MYVYIKLPSFIYVLTLQDMNMFAKFHGGHDDTAVLRCLNYPKLQEGQGLYAVKNLKSLM